MRVRELVMVKKIEREFVREWLRARMRKRESGHSLSKLLCHLKELCLCSIGIMINKTQ